MALRLAVVVSQAPGLGGTPSAGHRSTAVANASAAASSAMSRSPKRLVKEATTRAHSSRCAWVTTSRTPAPFTGTAGRWLGAAIAGSHDGQGVGVGGAGVQEVIGPRGHVRVRGTPGDLRAGSHG